ncbi:MAG: redoxin domain-containing protein [Bacteroidales bacterium]|nr:redoxin domain-containing protein [Bacteroidales bacterium]
MKKLFLLVISVCLGIGLYAQQYVMTSKGYIIEGEIKKGVGYVTLRSLLNDGNELYDSVWMDKKGKFTFRGYTERSIPATLTVNGKKTYRIYLEPSMEMKLQINMKKNSFKTKNAPLTDKWYSIVNPVGIEDNTVYLSRLENWALNNPEDIFSPDIMASYLAYGWDYDKLRLRLNVLKGNAVNTYFYYHLRERQKQLESIRQGAKAPDITTAKDINSKTVSLTSFYKSKKYVLIDFTASYCKQCRDNIPSLSGVYSAYKPKGFDIYAVSLDDNRKQLDAFIKESAIPWTVVCDGKKWEGDAVKSYMIKSIPDNVLVDNTGKIVARNLSVSDLKNKLAELLDYKGYNITGKINGINEGIVKMDLLLENGKKESSSVRIKNGTFTFSGTVDKVCMAMITLPVKDGEISFFMDNDNITISGEKRQLENVKIQGSSSQDGFAAIASSCNNRKNPMQCLSDYVRNNPSSIYSPFIISSYLYPYLSEDDLAKAVNSLNGQATQMYQYALLKEDARKTQEAKDMQTDKAKDFLLKNIKGEDVTLYSEIGFTDYTLLIFWASWDNISVNRNLDYLKMQNNLTKKQSLRIIAVSLDDSRVQWENAVKDGGLQVFENVSDLKRWSSSVVRLYGLNSIPSNMLLDNQGNILGKNLGINDILNIISR